jgi:hypothetical protein
MYNTEVLIEKTFCVNQTGHYEEMGKKSSVCAGKLCLRILSRQIIFIYSFYDHLCGLVVRVSGYRSRGPGLISGATRFSEK